MKRIIFTLLIGATLLTACGKNDETETTTTIQTSEASTEQSENTVNLKIYTADNEIEYSEIENPEDKEALLAYFKEQSEKGNLVKLPNGETVRLEFLKEKPEDTMGVRVFLVQDGEISLHNESDLTLKTNYADLSHQYDENDKSLEGVIYQISPTIDGKKKNYVYAVKIDNKIKDADTQVEAGETVTGYLAEDEQKIYDEYKKTLKSDTLKGLEPLTIAKFYAQAHLEKDYKTAHTLITDPRAEGAEKPSQQDYIEEYENLDKAIADSSIQTIKSVSNGKFVDEGDNRGYIQFESKPDHPLALDMSKKGDIWYVEYVNVR